MPSEPTVFVVDDDQAVRSALQFTLRSAGLNVELFANSQEFLEKYDPSRPGCLILDVRMPWMSGLDLQERLGAHNIILPVIFLTGHGDVPMAVRALKRGAFEFLEKPFDNAVLLERVRQALAADAEARRREDLYRQIDRRLARLKPRERAVLDGMVAGHTNKVMAAQLKVSVSTVETHRKHIMETLEVHTLSELMRMILYYRQHKTQLHGNGNGTHH